jgi:hypothetical protein
MAADGSSVIKLMNCGPDGHCIGLFFLYSQFFLRIKKTCGLENRSFFVEKRGFVYGLLNNVGDNSDYITLNYRILVNSNFETNVK